jgi:peptidoglycan/LPS O-acetylase OafA/YrhL
VSSFGRIKPSAKNTIMRYAALDLVRCFAITLLLVAHIGQKVESPIGGFFGIPDFYYVSLGGVAVTVFLILSGTVLELKYGNKDIRSSRFIFKRILRIYPVYYLSLLFGIAVYAIRSYYETGHVLTNFSTLNTGDVFLSLTAGYAFVGKWGGPFVKTSWFIPLIMTMYVFFPFLSREIKKRPMAAVMILLIISAESRLILGYSEVLPKRPLDWFPICRVFEFSLGVYLANALPKDIFRLTESSKRFRAAILFISTLSFPLFLVHHPLLFLINEIAGRDVSLWISICLYVSLSLFVSWIIVVIDRKIPRSRIIKA